MLDEADIVFTPVLGEWSALIYTAEFLLFRYCGQKVKALQTE